MSKAGEPTTRQVAAAILSYCLCSSSMLMVNKLAVVHVKSPTVVTLSQFIFAAAFVLVLNLAKVVKIDPFNWDRAKYFAIYVLSFSVGTWANIKVLAHANIETVIVFRSCSPLAVCLLEYIFYGRDLPSKKSCLALLFITIGALVYIFTDREFQVKGATAYYWASLWWVVLVFQLTFGKFLVSNTGMNSMWTPVALTNSFAIVPVVVIGLCSSELSVHAYHHVLKMQPMGYVWLICSCVIGTLISFSGFWCQSMITATAYTVVGVMNKMLTVMVNTIIWDKHASPTGIAALTVCILSGSMYRQAPLRHVGTDEVNAANLAEKVPLAEDVSGDEGVPSKSSA